MRYLLLLLFAAWTEIACSIVVVATGGSDSIVVATDGNDSNAGTAAAPLATLQRAVDLAQPGDTIQVRSGVYLVPGPTRIVGKMATAAAPLTITGDVGAVLRAVGGGVPGVWRGIIEIDKSSFVIVKNIAVENSSFFGFRVQDSQNVTLQANRSEVSLGSGIYASGARVLRVEGNDVSRFCDRGQFGGAANAGCQEGISLENVDDFSVWGNRVHDAPQHAGVTAGGGEGIDIKQGSKNGVVAFNSVWNLVQLGIYVDGWSMGVSNVEVHGNRVWAVTTGIAVSSEAGGPVSDVRIHDNIVHNVGLDGIAITDWKSTPSGDGPRSRVRVFNNTIVNAGVKEAKPPYMTWTDWGTGINVLTTNLSGLQVFDNIVSGSKAVAMQVVPGVRAGSRVETNLLWPVPGWRPPNAYDGTTPIIAPPGFVSTTDFHLVTGSRAIGAGSGTAPFVDAANAPYIRPKTDLGALIFKP